ncbi:hypothetical protein ES703_101027 [subsurface metagenome]
MIRLAAGNSVGGCCVRVRTVEIHKDVAFNVSICGVQVDSVISAAEENVVNRNEGEVAVIGAIPVNYVIGAAYREDVAFQNQIFIAGHFYAVNRLTTGKPRDETVAYDYLRVLHISDRVIISFRPNHIVHCDP